jgi:hypothetical protein
MGPLPFESGMVFRNKRKNKALHVFPACSDRFVDRLTSVISFSFQVSITAPVGKVRPLYRVGQPVGRAEEAMLKETRLPFNMSRSEAL